jgi:GcrA cell cycle regulator
MGESNGHDNHKLSWLGNRIERLKTLWERGWSASEIGNELGVSRNAVIGKLHRIEGYTPPPHKPPPRKPPAPVWKPPPPPKRRVVINQPFLNLTLDELKRDVCRYPHGDQSPFRFCGQKVRPGAPWCALHCRMVYQRRPEHPPAARPWRCRNIAHVAVNRS